MAKHHTHQRTYKRTFRGMPVKDARDTIRVQPARQDIACAVRGDPTRCAYALFIKRVWRAKQVYIYQTVAYVQMLDEQGKPVIYRYIIKADAKTWVKAFDDGKPVNPAGFTLWPPPPSVTLDKMQANNRRYKSEGLREVWQERYEQRRETRPGPKPIASFRKGHGMVHLIGPAERLDVRLMRSAPKKT